MKEINSSLLRGSMSGLFGSLCCVTPLVLVLVGLSGVTGAMALAENLQQNFRWTVFIPLATLFLAGSIYFHIKKKEGTCNIRTIKKYKVYVIISVTFAVIVWAALIYVMVPAIFKVVS